MTTHSLKFMLLRDLVTRFVQGNRNTWLALALGLMATLVLSIWAAVSVLGWLWGQGKSLAESTPDVARTVATQIEQTAPVVRSALGELVPALKPEPPAHDVSGTDIGPVARFPGLARSHWHRDGREVTVRYEGRASYVDVLRHYTQGFAGAGFTQNVITATPTAEEHEYLRGAEKVRFKISQAPDGKTKTTIIAMLR